MNKLDLSRKKKIDYKNNSCSKSIIKDEIIKQKINKIALNQNDIFNLLNDKNNLNNSYYKTIDKKNNSEYIDNIDKIHREYNKIPIKLNIKKANLNLDIPNNKNKINFHFINKNKVSKSIINRSKESNRTIKRDYSNNNIYLNTTSNKNDNTNNTYITENSKISKMKIPKNKYNSNFNILNENQLNTSAENILEYSFMASKENLPVQNNSILNNKSENNSQILKNVDNIYNDYENYEKKRKRNFKSLMDRENYRNNIDNSSLNTSKYRIKNIGSKVNLPILHDEKIQKNKIKHINIKFMNNSNVIKEDFYGRKISPNNYNFNNPSTTTNKSVISKKINNISPINKQHFK